MTHQYPTLRQKKQAFKHFVLGTSFRLGLLVITGILLTSHVMKMSSVSTKGYEITKLQQQIQILEQEKQRLDVDIARLSSMSYIQERVKTMAFVPIEKPHYLTIHGLSVARR